MIKFKASFESLRKDREGEVKLLLTIPLSDEAIVAQIPIQTELDITVEANP